MVVAVNHELDVLGEGLFGIVGVDEFLLDGSETILTHMFVGYALLGKVVAFLIDSVVEAGTQLFVVDLVAVFAFDGLACLDGQLGNGAALDLDGLVGGLQGTQHHLFRNLLHLAFHHHDVVFGGGDNQVEVGIVNLVHGSVDDIFSVQVADAHFRNRTVEGDVADGQSRGGSQCG